MANIYEQKYNSISQNKSQIGNSALTGLATGASIGSSLGPAGTVVGAIIGAAGGWLSGLLSDKSRQEAEKQELYSEAQADRKTYYNYLSQVEDTRSSYIKDAKLFISNTRSSFDNKYGEGTYDMFDELFATIFNLPANGSTVSDVLENASIDKYVEISGTAGATLESMSLSDISAGYQEYLTSVIKQADGSYALATQQEKNLVNSYYADVSSYALEISNQFQNAFLQKISDNAEAASSLGSAQVQQASSGLRQTGSGTNLTKLQEFQNDLADVAYSSSLNYMTSYYESVLKNINTSLITNVSQIRNEISISASEQLNDLINSYNKSNSQLVGQLENIEDSEKDYQEIQESIKETEDFLTNHGQELEDYTSKELF